ncbi:MAG: hypothetical protein ACRCXZ_09750 [Patescibacteria group bacterium]
MNNQDIISKNKEAIFYFSVLALIGILLFNFLPDFQVQRSQLLEKWSEITAFGNKKVFFDNVYESPTTKTTKFPDSCDINLKYNSQEFDKVVLSKEKDDESSKQKGMDTFYSQKLTILSDTSPERKVDVKCVNYFDYTKEKQAKVLFDITNEPNLYRAGYKKEDVEKWTLIEFYQKVYLNGSKCESNNDLSNLTFLSKNKYGSFLNNYLHCKSSDAIVDINEYVFFPKTETDPIINLRFNKFDPSKYNVLVF